VLSNLSLFFFKSGNAFSILQNLCVAWHQKNENFVFCQMQSAARGFKKFSAGCNSMLKTTKILKLLSKLARERL